MISEHHRFIAEARGENHAHWRHSGVQRNAADIGHENESPLCAIWHKGD